MNPPTIVPNGAIKLKVFCAKEARRQKIAPDSVLQRINAGWYEGIELLKQNARRIWVLRPGTCRAPIAHKDVVKPARRVHERARLPLAAQKHFRPSPDKYSNWMSRDDCGGMTSRIMGNSH
jgi:hypothetical protein